MENNTTKTTRERKKLVMKDNVPFDSVGDLKITTTDELCRPINSLFKSIFKDCFGCKLMVQYQPERGSYIIIPTIVFQVLPTDQYEGESSTAFRPIGAVKASNVVTRIEQLSRKSTSGNMVEITEDGMDIFSDFLITNKNQKIDWNNCYRSYVVDNTTYIELFKIDLIKLIKVIYGEKDEFGSEYYYQVTPTYKISQYQYKALDNWTLNILRLNHDNEMAVANMLGMYVAPKTGINVITATAD